jgi:nucleotide-binding universal stress UspA family protein
MEEEARSHLGRAEGLLRSAGLAYRTEVRFGDPAEEILKAADGGEFDVIIMGRRGRGLSRALLGSVSDHVAKNARTPVTVVG